MEKLCHITILPADVTIEVYEGENLYTALLLQDIPIGEGKLRLVKGSISPTEDAEAESKAFSKKQLEDDWLLADQHRVNGDAVFTLEDEEKQSKTKHISKGYGLVLDIDIANICAGLADLDSVRIPWLSNIRSHLGVVDTVWENQQSLSRLSTEALNHIADKLRENINSAARKLCNKTGISPKAIRSVAIAGNYLINAVLLEQVPPRSWPPMGLTLKRDAGGLGLTILTPETPVYILPAAGAEFGGDALGSMLAANLPGKLQEEKITLLVDIGTKGQVIAAGRGRIIATSIPFLPFDGAQLSCGMSAHTGAIAEVALEERLRLSTIRDGRPKGICGAGMLSLLREMLRIGILDSSGTMTKKEDLPEDIANRFRITIEGKEFLLSPGDSFHPGDITITQTDIHRVQIAKASICAACMSCLKTLEAEVTDIAEILLAEGNATIISPEDALAIGMLPEVSDDKVISIGNAAWQGAYLCLTGTETLNKAEKILKQIEQLDLTSDLIYAAEFIKAMELPVPVTEADHNMKQKLKLLRSAFRRAHGNDLTT